MAQLVDDLIGHPDYFKMNDAASRVALDDVDIPSKERIVAVTGHDHSVNDNPGRLVERERKGMSMRLALATAGLERLEVPSREAGSAALCRRPRTFCRPPRAVQVKRVR